MFMLWCMSWWLVFGLIVMLSWKVMVLSWIYLKCYYDEND